MRGPTTEGDLADAVHPAVRPGIGSGGRSLSSLSPVAARREVRLEHGGHQGLTPAGESRLEHSFDGERARIEQVYGRYQTTGRDVVRWGDDQPGNRCMLEERRRAAQRLLGGRPRPDRILEVGCGGGTVLRELQGILGTGTSVHGVDLLFDRLRVAGGEGRHPVQADGRQLPYADHEFDLVVVYTVFSSILDAETQRAVADEIKRVLSFAGAILWYDLRYPSPNRSVRPLGHRAVRALFPGMDVDLDTITVLPPLARRLGRRDQRLYPVLGRIPIVRSHLMGLIRPVPPSASPPSAGGAAT